MLVVVVVADGRCQIVEPLYLIRRERDTVSAHVLLDPDDVPGRSGAAHRPSGDAPPVAGLAQVLRHAGHGGQGGRRSGMHDEERGGRHRPVRTVVCRFDHRVEREMCALLALGRPDLGDRLFEGAVPLVRALFAVQDAVFGEERHIPVDVSSGGGVVGADEELGHGKAIVWVEVHEPDDGSGRNQAPIRFWRAAGNTFLGTMPWTVLGGVDV